MLVLMAETPVRSAMLRYTMQNQKLANPACAMQKKNRAKLIALLMYVSDPTIEGP